MEGIYPRVFRSRKLLALNQMNKELKMKIKQEDIRDSIIYIFRYCLYRNTYAVSTAQNIINL